MRIIAFILLLLSFVTLVPASGVDILPTGSDSEQQVITVLNVCNQGASGVFSGLDFPYLSECSTPLLCPCCYAGVDSTPPSFYTFIDYFQLDRPPRV